MWASIPSRHRQNLRYTARMVKDLTSITTARGLVIEAPMDALKGYNLKRKEAFEIYYAQGLDGDRNIQEVADVLGVPVTEARKWARADKWDLKAASRDQKVDNKLDELAVQKVADIKARYHKQISHLIEQWFVTNVGDEEKLNFLLATMDVDDIVKLVKTSLTLLGEPETIKKIEGTVTHTLEEKLSSMSDDELRQLAQGQLPAHSDEVIDAEVVAPIGS